MSSRLVTARLAAADIIAALTPTQEPTIRFRRASGDQPLREIPLSHSPSENTRLFLVRCGAEEGTEFGGFGGLEVDIVQSLVVEVLYHVPTGHDLGGYTRRHDLIGSDHALICAALNKPPISTQWGAFVINILPDRPSFIEVGDDVWLMEARFELRYQGEVPA